MGYFPYFPLLSYVIEVGGAVPHNPFPSTWAVAFIVLAILTPHSKVLTTDAVNFLPQAVGPFCFLVRLKVEGLHWDLVQRKPSKGLCKGTYPFPPPFSPQEPSSKGNRPFGWMTPGAPKGSVASNPRVTFFRGFLGWNGEVKPHVVQDGVRAAWPILVHLFFLFSPIFRSKSNLMPRPLEQTLLIEECLPHQIGD